MTISKPKTKDQSNSKFLQRIAGRKALGPPPTPRPIIGEHPVRTLLRENADEIEEIKAETPVLEETPVSNITAPVEPESNGLPPQISEETLAVDALAIEHLKSDTGVAEREPVEASRKLEAAPENVEEIDTLRVTKRAASAKARAEARKSAPRVGSAEEQIINIGKKYRLNSGEFSLYRELYLMTHAVGETECSFVVSELVKSTGMLERRVRDNLRRLKKMGWLVLLESYDFQNREKAKYRVNTEPGL